MKRFILISMLAVLTMPMLACGWAEPDNTYLYHLYDNEEFSYRVDKITCDNWMAYLGIKEDYFYFNADQVIAAAQKKGDALMVSYVKNLQKYLKCCDDIQADQWNYPTKEELAQRNQTLRDIRTYALSKVKTKLRSQHALLYMRCNMVLGLNKDNITFWETMASQYIETVYKDMMKNIYAGALYKTGRDAEAGELFAAMGDYKSLMTQFYKRRSFAAIRQEYQRDANAGVLPFLLQDFVNNAQEAADGGMEGKLFIRDIKEAEAMQMAQFAAQVVKESKTQDPAMWKAAEGWLYYLFGKKQQGYSAIQQAVKMQGSKYAETSARLINLYISSDVAPANEQFDRWLTGELQWARSEMESNYYVTSGFDRIMRQVLTKRYVRRPVTLLAMLQVMNNAEYGSQFDNARVEDLEQLMTYRQQSFSNPLDQWLQTLVEFDQPSTNEHIGTKYLRVCQWEKAIEWLNKVPLSYLSNLSNAVYAANRSYTVEPWITRQWLSDEVEYSSNDIQLKSNYKIDFAKEMLRLEREAAIAKGDEQCRRYFDLAVRYSQASYTGDCWFITRYGKSGVDSVGVNENDFGAIARNLLTKASQAKDRQLKERALFARCYYYLHPGWWYDQVWNDQHYRLDFVPMPQSSQYQALQALADFERSKGAPSAYVSKCDVYITFLKRR